MHPEVKTAQELLYYFSKALLFQDFKYYYSLDFTFQ